MPQDLGTPKSHNGCVRWGLSSRNPTLPCSSRKVQKVRCAYCCMWTTWSSSAPIFWNQPSKVPVVEYIWDEGLGGPSILPRDWSDQHTRRDIAHSMTLCLEYNMFTFRSGRMTHILFNYYFWISFYWWVRYYFHHNSIQCIKLVCTIFFLN